MTAEVNKWIGAPGTPGFLNAAPFNPPPGLNIHRTAPATASAPAG